MSNLARVLVLLVAAASSLASFVQSQPQPVGYAGQGQPQGQQGQQGQPQGNGCEPTCDHYLGCRGLQDPNIRQQCVSECAASPPDPQFLARFLAADCPTAIAMMSGEESATPAAPSAPAAPSCQGTAEGGDPNLYQLLLRSPWCGFAYSPDGNATQTSRYVFGPDGVVRTFAGNASSSSGTDYGPNGEFRSRSSGSQSSQSSQACWRLQGTTLLISGDGRNAGQVIPLQVMQGQNGYPILRANGTDYAMCN